MRSSDKHDRGGYIRDRPLRILPYIHRSLIACLISLGLIIVVGTVYGIFFNSASPIHRPASISHESENGEEGQIFTGIGRLRISTADSQSGMVIINVSFIYYPEDSAFSEELALRIGSFREIISQYIGSFSTIELKEKAEENIKAELLRRFNTILRLGQIENLFFTDFMIIG